MIISKEIESLEITYPNFYFLLLAYIIRRDVQMLVSITGKTDHAQLVLFALTGA